MENSISLQNILQLPTAKCLPNLVEFLKANSKPDIYIKIIEKIFDPENGWNLDLIYAENSPLEFSALFAFLKAEGPLFKCINILCLNEVFFKTFNFSYDMSKNNAFEFYFLAFFSYFNHLQNYENVNANTYNNSVYDELVQSYCSYFMPLINTRLSSSHNNIYVNNKFKSQNMEWPLVNLTYKNIHYLQKFSQFNQSILDLIFDPVNFPTIVFLEIFVICILKKYTNMEQNQNDLTQHPSLNEMALIHTFLIHIFHFAAVKLPCIIGDYSSSKFNKSISHIQAGNINPYTMLRRYMFPLFIQEQFYQYLYTIITCWPLLPTFRIALNAWLTFIQPWKYVESVQDYQSKSVTLDWKNYIMMNYQCYTSLLNRYLLRTTQYDLLNSQNCYELYRVLKTFIKGDLFLLINKISLSAKQANLECNENSKTLNVVINRLLPIIYDSIKIIEHNLAGIARRDQLLEQSTFDTDLPPPMPPLLIHDSTISRNNNERTPLTHYWSIELTNYLRWIYQYGVYAFRRFLRSVALLTYQYIIVSFGNNFIWYGLKYMYYSIKYRGSLDARSSSKGDAIDRSPLFIELMARGSTSNNSNKELSTYDNKFFPNSTSPLRRMSAKWISGISNLQCDEHTKLELEKCLSYLRESDRMIRIIFGPIDPNLIPSLNTCRNRQNYATVNAHTNISLLSQPNVSTINQTGVSSTVDYLAPKISQNYSSLAEKHTSHSRLSNSLINYINSNFDSQEAPIKSYEIGWLVRLLYHISLFLNDKLQTRVQIFYLKQDFCSSLLRVFTTPFITWRPPNLCLSPSFQKRLSPNFGMFSDQLRPAIDLRILANYHLLGFIFPLLTLLFIFGWGYQRILTWFVILVFANAFLESIHLGKASNGGSSYVNDFNNYYWRPANKFNLCNYFNSAQDLILTICLTGLLIYLAILLLR